MGSSQNIFQKISSIASTSLALSALLGSLLLVSGFSYQTGYLNAFNIGLGVLPLHLQDSLPQAFSLGIIYSAYLINHIHWPFLALLGLPLIYLLLFLTLRKPLLTVTKRMRYWLLQQISAADQPFSPQRFIRIIAGDTIPVIWAFMLATLGFLIIFSYMLAHPYIKGREDGIRQIEQFDSVDHDCRQLPAFGLNCGELSLVADGRSLSTGLVVSGEADSFVALYDGENIQIFERSPDYSLMLFTKVPSEEE